MGMIPYPSQIELAKEAYTKLRKYGIAYLAMEERTGKSLTGILAIEEFAKNDIILNPGRIMGLTLRKRKVLIITKKQAIAGWNETLANCGPLESIYKVVNYHQVHKQDPALYNTVILDEAHNYISACPKPSKMWRAIKPFVGYNLAIYMSATPHAQGMQMLYHQLALSEYSPWAGYKSFYTWYNEFAQRDQNGFTKKVHLSGRTIETYDSVQTKRVGTMVQHLFITKTRAQLGFDKEPTDMLHYLQLNPQIEQIYNSLLKDRVLKFNTGGKDYTLVADTPMKLRTALHMLEGGALKVDDDYLVLRNNEKVDYIKRIWGDSPQLVIMYQYIAEGHKLRKHFNFATVLQGTSFAEGIDLSHKEHLVIYSQDFSTAKHTQRRARQANRDRKGEIEVHYLLVKKAISDQVYKTVSVNKRNFVDSLFTYEEL